MKKFCAIPWNELVYGSQMNYSVCCKWQEHDDKNTNSDKPAVEHYNSARMKNLRQRFIEGAPIPECKACWEDEDNGRFSMRMRRNQHYYGKADISIDDDVVKNVVQQTVDGGYNTNDLHGLHISTGDKCQLRCVDCAPAYSRSILKDYKKLGWDKNFKARRHVTQVIDLRQREQAHWDSIRENSRNLKIIRLTGGEPSINNNFVDYLKWCVKNKIAQEVEIHIPTNAVNVKDSFLEPLKEFKKVMFSLSVDGVNDLDEYVRYPTNWSKKIDNVEKMIKLFPHSNIHTVVYALNVFNLENIYKFGEQYPINHSIELLTYPDELSVRHLPNHIKDEVIKKLQPLLSETSASKNIHDLDKKQYSLNGLSAVVSRLREPGTEEQWQKCKSIVKAYDTIRKKPLNSILGRNIF